MGSEMCIRDSISTNHDLTRRLADAKPTNQHYQLFKSYVTSRHDDGQMARMDRDDFNSMISNSPIETMLIDYVDQDHQLVGSVLTDKQQDGMSAVYSFFDPEFNKFGLGNYMIIQCLLFGRSKKYEYLYLGYYIEELSSMSYKSRFKPGQILKNNEWENFNFIPQ